jgi:predicted metal-dependent HD superfamily phosphohydrolase
VLERLGVPPVVVDEAARLVRTTATHAVEVSDEAGAVLADADLWILGSPPERYRRYAAAVRREYGFLSDHDWRTGRSAVLDGFARRPRLYVSDRAHRALDAGARRNLAWELAALGGGQAQP